ncbi:nucleoprotein TPR-like [Maniola jurtina]|uniref:nucleoprotein TPR-like n=1 Tax=Maniola jurtina TaxID=191418 RepID=UPI001E68F678|nr:nucleoprotein TPR-like [Maniola jurtina]
MENSHNVVDPEAERCVCEGGPTLAVLKDVQRAYEEKMELINRTGGSQKLQKQVELLQSWVSDLVSQNTLLTRTVEELETEVTSRLLLERRRHSERDMDKKACGKVNEMKVLNESLKMENVTKDREIKRLNKDMQQYEQTILTLRNELSNSMYHSPDVSKKDAEVMVDICCSGTRELEMVTSTPNLSHEKMTLDESRESVVEHPPSPPLLLTDSSLNESHHELSPRSILQHQPKSEPSVVDRGVKKKPQADKKRKDIGKEAESNDNGHSTLILIEAMECDCEDENLVDKESQNERKEASKENIDGKEKRFAKAASKANIEASTANERAENGGAQNDGIESKNRHVSLAQITAKRSGDNTGNSFRKKGIRRDTTADKKTKKTKHSNESESCDTMKLNESLGAHSVADSSASEAARAHSLETKLLATMQILKNKEETVRVQAESLALAEARIAALTAKAHKHQAQQTALFTTRSSSAGCHIEMTDVSSAADLQVMDHKIVNTLRDNLSVIEELYRECFYESAKQEELITMLRRSYLDMRLMERQKSEQIGRLQNTVHSQRCSLERCQDIAMEVENLKSEITNFLNSSQNNDSGVWEREDCVGDVAEDLRVIAHQLLRLRDMLNTDCTCGLEEENMKLKKINETMEIQIGELRQRINDLEESLDTKNNMNQQYQARIHEKEQELQHVRAELEANSREQDNTCDALNCKLKQMEAALKDKSSELLSVKQQCAAQEAAVKALREELNRADVMAQESGQVREEVSCLSSQVAQWREQLSTTRRRLRALEAELQRAREHCRHLATHYREKAQLAEELQSQLEEAQSRGTELCGEARRAVCGVRHWLHKQRQKNRELEEKIKQQEILIQTLQRGASNPSEHTDINENEPCCSKHLTRVEARRSDHSFVSASETGCSKCASRKTIILRTSESEIASSPAPPTPPRRLLRKKPFCGDIRCQWPSTRESSAQRPARSDASVSVRLSSDRLSSYTATPTGEMSQTDELLERVERAHEALAEAHQRWSRGAAGRDVDR